MNSNYEIICFFLSVPFIKKTWAKDALNIEYYSETADKSIPTITLGIANTERGMQLEIYFFYSCLIVLDIRIKLIDNVLLQIHHL